MLLSPSAAALMVGGTVPEARRRGRAARALSDVFVDLEIVVVMAVGEALHRRDDHLRVELVDALPA